MGLFCPTGELFTHLEMSQLQVNGYNFLPLFNKMDCFQDVFIVDTKKALIVWIGQETTTAERKNAMTYAHVSTASVRSVMLLVIHSVSVVIHI